MLLWNSQLSKHKFLEIQIDKFEEGDYFKFQINWTRKKDHAGLEIWLEVFGFVAIVNAYDHRHWNYDIDGWQHYE